MSSNVYDLSGIHIVNNYTRQSTETISEGYFAINARPGDTLIISDVNYVGLKFGISKEVYQGDLLYVKAEGVAHRIEEVTINQFSHINAVSMGILQKQPKSYTKAERALKAGGVFEGQFGTNMAIGLDPLFNALTGRTKILIADLAVERKLTTIEKLENLFSNEYLRDQMHIPEDRVEGFKFYLVEDGAFSSAIKNRNKTLATWLMAGIADKYNQIGKLGLPKTE